ncbi:GNAT family N-acetyltransferase [Bacillus sp. Marseille-Q3570]|uniref:GNAT family N-acetyltransferase n=1 Tax=Bacillus sp. Marseille-Q3570 TaxID=2963522 RepID=UPI0021B719C8|nr:GNAT family N-acetyltransferase [Bacillus sp. Marseille-Q3570]
MDVISTNILDKEKIINFFIEQWGSMMMVLSTGVYHCDQLDGFAVIEDDGALLGLITYIIENNECEIISLDSLQDNQGIGSTLLHKLETYAKEKDCDRVKLITTNDNLHALGFYQKRGYRLTEIFVNAVDECRKIKPEISLFADNGIPIRDEILLSKPIKTPYCGRKTN